MNAQALSDYVQAVAYLSLMQEQHGAPVDVFEGFAPDGHDRHPAGLSQARTAPNDETPKAAA